MCLWQGFEYHLLSLRYWKSLWTKVMLSPLGSLPVTRVLPTKPTMPKVPLSESLFFEAYLFLLLFPTTVNYGGLLLRSLFEHWPYAYVGDDEDSPLQGFYSLPLHTPILIRWANQPPGELLTLTIFSQCNDDIARPLFRTTVHDTASQADSAMLRDVLPSWVLQVHN